MLDRPIWSPEKARELRAQGVSLDRIAKMLGTNRQKVAKACRGVHCEVVPIDYEPVVTRPIPPVKLPNDLTLREQAVINRLGASDIHVRNYLHVRDLLRAGHDPRQTEFIISEERGLIHSLARIAELSYVGSTAALCAGF